MPEQTTYKNFNGKYFVLWYKIVINPDDYDNDVNGEPTKLNVLWIKSWKHRYLTVGHVYPGGVGHRIGIQKGDRLGYFNGIIAPKLENIKAILNDKNSIVIHLGMLRKHCQETFTIINMMNCHLKQSSNDNDRLTKIFNDRSMYESASEHEQQELAHIFVNNSAYHSLKDPFLYSLKNQKSKSKLKITSIKTEDDNKENNEQMKFLENKENYRPNEKSIFSNLKNSSDQLNMLNDNDDDKFHFGESKSSLSYSKYPDNIFKSQIDSSIKSQRVFRNIENISTRL